jgi:hypothetical protein
VLASDGAGEQGRHIDGDAFLRKTIQRNEKLRILEAIGAYDECAHVSISSPYADLAQAVHTAILRATGEIVVS